VNFSASWDWGSISAGTVSPTLSQYGLSGTSVTGGLLELTPGSFLFQVTGGRSQRAVDPSTEQGFRSPAYERWLYGGKIGFGQQSGTHLHLGVMYARDNENSIEQAGNITPKENLTVSPDVGFSLFQNIIEFRVAGTASVLSRDTRARAINIQGPEFATSIFQPRISTRASFAGQASLNLNLDPFQLQTSYERVQPGFRSLGISRIRSDYEAISVRPQLNLWNGRVRLGGRYSQGRDNLLDNKLATSERKRYGINSMFRVSRAFALTMNYNRFNNSVIPTTSDQQSQQLEQSTISQSYMVQPNITFMTGAYSHNISLSGVYEKMDHSFGNDTSSTQTSQGFNNLNTSMTYGLTFPSGFSVNLTGNYLRNNAGAANTSNYGFSMGTGFGLFQQAVRVSVNAGFSANATEQNSTSQTGTTSERRANQIYGNLNATYRLPNNDTIRLSVRNTNNNQRQGPGNSFQELQARLRYQHQF